MATQVTGKVGPDITETTVVLNLTIGKVGNRKKIDTNREDVMQTDVDREMLHLSKELFDAEEYDACRSFLRGLKTKIRYMSVPYLLKGGMYLVKAEAIEEVESALVKAQKDFKPLVKQFADVVDKRRDESKERLGVAFDAADYPNANQVMAAFSISWRWLSLSTPSKLKQISKAFFEREAKKAEEGMKSIVENAQMMLLKELAEISSHIVDRLTPDDKGKRKTFQKTIVSNVIEYLDTLKFRKLTDNEAVDAQIGKMRALLSGVTPESLKENDKLRADVADGFKKVSKALDKALVDQPRRFMDLGSEE